MAAIAKAMGFPPGAWFEEDAGKEPAVDWGLAGALSQKPAPRLMGSVPREERVRALQALGLWCQMELMGTEPPQEVLEKLDFNSIEGNGNPIRQLEAPGAVARQRIRNPSSQEGTS
jgi:hypothetical protein